MRTGIFLAVGFVILASSSLHAQTGAQLRAGDVFDLRLSGVPQEYAADFALQYAIDEEGSVHVPLIGEMKAAGLRPAQLERAMEDRLTAAHIFTRPVVLINVSPTSRHISVSGGVRSPQRLQWSSDVTLSSAIGECGGFTDFAQGSKIRLVRDGKIAGVYRLKDLQRDPARDPKLSPGDQVIVPE
ncbi:MAG TPA: polysaccharide biosynthesis/export family protein [Chthoniobacter sp.]|nr:polysaccharide biosynthesis/export family protein [Chthoniobacter sp.]